MSYIFPATDKNGFYEMRLESIGGLGANLCGKMLGELGALYLSVNACSFSSYGSEKRGAPVKSYIRYSRPEKEIRVNSPVTRPDLLVIFHEGLLGSHSVLSGVTQNTRIILNTPRGFAQLSPSERPSAGTLFCIDALDLARKHRSRINMVLLGAIVKVSGFIPLAAAEQMCRETVGKKYPSLTEANLNGLRAGYEKISAAHPCIAHMSSPDGSALAEPVHARAPGGINPCFGSTVTNDLSPSREGYIPLFMPENCIHCGLCELACPDMVFQFAPGVYNGKECMVNTGLDYLHCKGCLRCVGVCPARALIAAEEKDYPQKPLFRPNRHLLADFVPYEKSGPNSWVTSDSYLSEKREDGGVV